MDKILSKKITLNKYTLDIAVGIVSILIGLFLFFIGIPNHISLGLSVVTGVLTPQSFPKLVSILFMVLGAAVFGTALFNKKDAAKRNTEPEQVEFYLISLAVVALILFFALSIRPLGYPITNALMMLGMFYLSGGKKIWKGILVALIFTAVSTWFFAVYLKLSVPMGILAFILY